MINVSQLKSEIIAPVLQSIGLYSEHAVNLLVGTALQESLGGTYVKQIKGPACGIYQMEPATARDIIDNFLKYKKELSDKVFRFYNRNLTLEENLISNLFFATAMCRVHYFRVKEALPTTVVTYGDYWKRYYNTVKGKGTVTEFVSKYREYVGEK